MLSSRKLSMNIYNDDTLWHFHQTPESLCKDIISNIDFKEGEKVLEPFAGTNGFYDNLASEVIKYRCEIRDNLDYRMFDYEGIRPETILSNPPYDLGENPDRKRKNDFFNIVLFFSKKPYIKRIIFLCSSACYNSLTPKRMMSLNEQNLFLNKVTSCFIKKWRGIYYVMEFTRKPNTSFDYLLGVY